MTEFGKLLLIAFALSLLVIAGVTIPVYMHTGSISTTILVGLYVIASGAWGWVVAGIDYRNEKRNREE